MRPLNRLYLRDVTDECIIVAEVQEWSGTLIDSK